MNKIPKRRNSNIKNPNSNSDLCIGIWICLFYQNSKIGILNLSFGIYLFYWNFAKV